MLEERAARGERSTDDRARFELMDLTREALFEEADAICEHAADGMDFRSPAQGSAPGQHADRSATGDGHREPTADGPAPRVVVRHRFDKARRDGSDRTARRIVTLRDRRRGRPPKPPQGSDPPA